MQEGYNLLQDRLSDMFFRPFLKLLLEVYSFIRQEDIKLFKSYLGNHSHENISLHSEIKPKLVVDISYC